MRWTAASLQALIDELRARQGDLTDVEVKSAAGGVPRLAPTICAFANMPEGGTIILGLDERAGFTPVGLSNIATLEQGISSQARNSVTPPVRIGFQTFAVAGRSVLVGEVEALPLHDRPARHGGLAYLRQSDGDYVMSEQEIAQIELAKTQARQPTKPDRQPMVGTTTADLDSGLLAASLAAARASSRRYATASDGDVLRYTGVVTSSGELTLAGSYALGVHPQSSSPSLGITCAVQLPPGGPTRTGDLVHLVGPIPELLDDAMAWVARNTRTSMGYDERGHGVDVTEIPMRAVREIIANALVHRNLDAITDSKRVEVRLLEERLVITSPGGLWGVSESQLGRPGAKSAVNPVLYDVCKLVRMPDGSRVIEGEGGGIREALDALGTAGLRPPRFVDNGVRFTVIIYRHTLIGDADLAWLSRVTEGVELTSEQRAILVSMRHGDVWTNSRVRQQFVPTDSVAARRMLQQMVDAGLSESSGKGGSTTYEIAPAISDGVVAVTTEVEELIGAAAETSHLQSAKAPAPSPDTATQPNRPPSGGRPMNQIVVLSALDEPRTLQELMRLTALSEGQVRYALRPLIEAGAVDMRGRQGMRGTTYAVGPNSV